MERLSISELTTFRWTFEQDVLGYRQAGFDGIGVWREKLSDYGEEKGIELIEDAGLSVSSLQWAGGFTGSDGRNLRDSIDDAIEAIHLAKNLEAECLLVYTGARGGHTRNHSRRIFNLAMNELVPAAQQASVKLAIEPMHRRVGSDWTFLDSVEETIDVLESIGSDSVGIVFDLYQLCHNDCFANRIENFASHIALVQLADAKHSPREEQERYPIGHGALPIAEIVQQLDTCGYDGFYEVELMGPEIETIDYDLLLRETRAAVEQMQIPS